MFKLENEGYFTPESTDSIICLGAGIATTGVCVVAVVKEDFFKITPNPIQDQLTLSFYNPVRRFKT